MPPVSGTRLLSAVRRLLPPAEGSDADLLGRFVAGRDEAAFEALVRRHGPMVHATCRRELGPGPDADDAFQVAFLVLARDAGRIAAPAALPGWLHRVARLSALKLRAGRRVAAVVRDDDAADPADPVRDAAGRELSAALDRELDGLSDKLRAVFVLCCLEERTSGEAARVLGCPVGTVESRLAAARDRLRTRLARRGFGLPAAGLALGAASDVGGAAVARLVPGVVATAREYAADGTTVHPLSPFADGVTPIMGTAKLKLLVAAGMSAALFGTAGIGLVRVSADPPKADPPPAAAAKPDAPKKAELPPSTISEAGKPAENPGPPKLKDERDVRTALTRPVADVPPGMKLRDLLEYLHASFGINARLDTAAFKRVEGIDAGMAAAPGRPPRDPAFVAADVEFVRADVATVLDMYEKVIALPVTRGMTVADLLTEICAQLPGRCSYRIRGDQVLIGPAYIPPSYPGRAEEGGGPIVPVLVLIEQTVGEPVSVSLEERPFAEALKEIRKLTGANIVLDARCKDKAKELVTGTFDDTRLLTVLTVLADQCDLKPVAMNNVYYVTTPDNAAKLQKTVNRELFGEPEPPAAPTPAPLSPAGSVVPPVGKK